MIKKKRFQNDKAYKNHVKVVGQKKKKTKTILNDRRMKDTDLQ